MEDLFFELLTDKFNLKDRLTVYEYFLYKTLDNLEAKFIEATEVVDLFEHFEKIAVKHNNQFYSAFFFSLAEILTLKHHYKKFEPEIISRSSFEKEFDTLKKKLFAKSGSV